MNSALPWTPHCDSRQWRDSQGHKGWELDTGVRGAVSTAATWCQYWLKWLNVSKVWNLRGEILKTQFYATQTNTSTNDYSITEHNRVYSLNELLHQHFVSRVFGGRLSFYTNATYYIITAHAAERSKIQGTCKSSQKFCRSHQRLDEPNNSCHIS